MALTLNAELTNMLADSGASPKFGEYLFAMRIINWNVLAVFSPDETHYKQHLVEPSSTGSPSQQSNTRQTHMQPPQQRSC